MTSKRSKDKNGGVPAQDATIGSVDNTQARDPLRPFSEEQLTQVASIVTQALKEQSEAQEASRRLLEDSQGAPKKQRTGQGPLSDEEGEDQVDEVQVYMEDLKGALQEGDKLGPPLHDLVISVFEHTVGKPIDTLVIGKKRAAHPRPANAESLKVPALNDTLVKAIKAEHLKLDRKAVEIQKTMAATMAAVGRQTTCLFELKEYLMDEQRVEDHSDAAREASTAFCALMDSNLMLTRTFSDLTNLRRETVKLGLSNVAASVITEKNPATADWLAGPDVHAEMERVLKEKKDADQFKINHSSHFSANKSTGYQGNGKNSQHTPQSKDKWKKGGGGKPKYDNNKKKSYGNSTPKQKSNKEDFQHRGSR